MPSYGTRRDENGYDDSGGDVGGTRISGLDANSTSWPGADARQGRQPRPWLPLVILEWGLSAAQAIFPH